MKLLDSSTGPSKLGLDEGAGMGACPWHWHIVWLSVFRIRIHWVRIRIQHFRLNTHPDPILMTTNGKNLQLKFYSIFLILYCNLLILGLYKGRLNYMRSLQPSKENIQRFKTWNFLIFFPFLWIIFALLDPDPLSWLNPYLGYRITVPKIMASGYRKYQGRYGTWIVWTCSPSWRLTASPGCTWKWTVCWWGVRPPPSTPPWKQGWK